MHILIACNKTTIAILHGQKLMKTDKVKEYIVKKKKNKTEVHIVINEGNQLRNSITKHTEPVIV